MKRSSRSALRRYSCAAAGSSPIGVFGFHFFAFIAAVTTFRYQLPSGERDHGTSPPSRTDFSGSITRSASTSSRKPRPVHSGQAPCGELKLNDRGSRSSITVPSYGQPSFSLKSRSSKVGFDPSAAAEEMITSPSPSFSAVSTESERRLRSSGGSGFPFSSTGRRTTKRSTTTSMLCRFFLSSFGASSRS